jgi:hypothetical protein
VLGDFAAELLVVLFFVQAPGAIDSRDNCQEDQRDDQEGLSLLLV